MEKNISVSFLSSLVVHSCLFGALYLTARNAASGNLRDKIAEFAYLREDKVQDLTQEKKIAEFLKSRKKMQEQKKEQAPVVKKEVKKVEPKKVPLPEKLVKKILPPQESKKNKIVEMKSFTPPALKNNLPAPKNNLIQDKKYVAPPASPGLGENSNQAAKIVDKAYRRQIVPNAAGKQIARPNLEDKVYSGVSSQSAFKVDAAPAKGELVDAVRIPGPALKANKQMSAPNRSRGLAELGGGLPISGKGSLASTKITTASISKGAELSTGGNRGNVLAKSNFSGVSTGVGRISQLDKGSKYNLPPTIVDSARKSGSGVSIRTYGKISTRKILSSSMPDYPVWAEMRGIEGIVSLLITVLPNGEVKEKIMIDKTSGCAVIDQAAIQAVKKWRFAALDKKEEEQGVVTFIFRLGSK
ncbi:MAG: energy transducer TonB [Elusimicrobiota bacterium]